MQSSNKRRKQLITEGLALGAYGGSISPTTHGSSRQICLLPLASCFMGLAYNRANATDLPRDFPAAEMEKMPQPYSQQDPPLQKTRQRRDAAPT